MKKKFHFFHIVLGLKITCSCHQSKIAICCHIPLVVLIAPKIYSMRFSDTEKFAIILAL